MKVFLTGLTEVTDGRPCKVRSLFSYEAIDDLTTLLAVENERGDILVVHKHILLSFPVGNRGGDEIKALLIDKRAIGEYDMGGLHLAAALNAVPESREGVLMLLEERFRHVGVYFFNACQYIIIQIRQQL